MSGGVVLCTKYFGRVKEGAADDSARNSFCFHVSPEKLRGRTGRTARVLGISSSRSNVIRRFLEADLLTFLLNAASTP